MIRLPDGLSKAETDLYKAIFTECDELIRAGMSVQEAIQKVIIKFTLVVTNPVDLRLFLQSEITVYSEPTIAITTEEIRRDKWWEEQKSDPSFLSEYWIRYYDYMRLKPSWSIRAIDDIDDSTDKVMNALANPHSSTGKERMGLVFGYVQSGKTAHYIGLINKAYDAGYKIIIVLSGIHNSLRSQTQARIDEEVLGYETSIEYLQHSEMVKNCIGVGVGRQNQISGNMLQSITTRDENGDVSKKTIGVSVNPPFIIVTKKVATVLRNIIGYFKKSPIADSENGKKFIPSDYPALIIDDEADQASINTKETRDKDGNYLDEYNPSTINGLIRKLLMLFKSRTYVGYTATPYANIFIDPKTPANPFGSDIFPRDFIFRAPKSSMYVGAREFFGLTGDEASHVMPLYRKIKNGSSYLGKGTKSDDPVGPIPEDMKKAVRYFVVSTALRNCRGQINKPNTMLIHVIRFVSQQNQLKKKVKEYYEDLENQIRYGDFEIKEDLKSIWEEDFIPTTYEMKKYFPSYMDGAINISWSEVWNEIVRISIKKEITIYSINGKSRDSLIYKEHEGKTFNVIVIGGDKLSRGLTLEGLTVSYFTRGSNTYDTLMQMGRWFGFRPGYLDACRLFTTSELYGAFSHISMATEDLAEQFEYMDEVDQTPEDFGLRVATHPTLLITSRNKLRNGIETMRDYSCKLSQTRVFDINGETFDHNFEAVEVLLKSIGKHITAEQYRNEFQKEKPGGHYFWRKVSGQLVAAFFESYETSAAASRANSKYMADYVREMNRVGGLTDWTICLINIRQEGKRDFQIAGLSVGAGIYRKEGSGVDSKAGNMVSIHTMTSAGHEYYDYTKKLDSEREKLKERLESEGKRGISERIRSATREFSKGLLLLYPIADAGKLRESMIGHKTPFGFAAVFPDRKGKGKLKSYRLNEIAVERDNDELYD